MSSPHHEFLFAAFAKLLGEFFEQILTAYESIANDSGPHITRHNHFHFAVADPVAVLPALVLDVFHSD
jgi:hypothetical protein